MEYIPFEKPIAELELKVDELRKISSSQNTDLQSEIQQLEQKASLLRKEIFEHITPYQATQLSRHPRRPNTLEILDIICDEFQELHGDRNFLDDKAIVGGLARIGDVSFVAVGHQKGRGTKANIERNFGMPKPEGYRKALRLMSLAERFSLPIITFVDTPGAYPGIGAEERGQSEAIAKNIMVMNRLKVPILTFVIGEGGSGGALGIAVANKIHMLQYSVYSVISPEGCASILMKDASRAEQAADALKLTAQNALKHHIIDSIIPEPEGGAHRNLRQICQSLKQQILGDLKELAQYSPEQLRDHRIEKFLNMGAFTEKSAPSVFDS